MAPTAMPIDLAVLLAGVVARQAASATACAQARLAAPVPVETLLAPRHGAFHRPAALSLERRKE